MPARKFVGWLQKAGYFLPVVVFGLALLIVRVQLKHHGLTEIIHSAQSLPWPQILLALLLTVVNYLVLAGYDLLALNFTGYRTIPLPKILGTSLLSYAITNNTGHAWAAGGSIRYRFYLSSGVSSWDIVRISLFLSITYLLGVITLGFIGSVVLPLMLPGLGPQPMITSLAWISAVSLAAYWAATWFWHKAFTFRGFEIRLPSPKLTFWQTLVSCADIILASLVLLALLAGRVSIHFEMFLLVFVIAQLAGVLSQVPGGLGVFESAFLWLIGQFSPPGQHLVFTGALLLYRAIYFFLPLLCAGFGLLGVEIYQRRQRLLKSGESIQKTLTAIVPQTYSLILFFVGSVLLISGSIPAEPQAIGWLQIRLPLPVIEISHLAGSVTGLILVFLARGIYLKIDAAWYGGLLFLSLGILVSLLKGLDWQEALLLTVALCLLLPTKTYFQRSSSLWRMPFNRQWIVLIAAGLLATGWLGFFAYEKVAYTNALWWQFSFKGDAPRFLRALLLTSVLTLAFVLYRLFSVATPKIPYKPSEQELLLAATLVSQSNNTRGFLALLGDKYLFWNTAKTAFIMFCPESGFWLAMGDPVGDEHAFDDLVWSFREQADRHGAQTVFYQIGENYLPIYLDIGLSFYKLGQEAKIHLADFNLQGHQHDSQRSALNRFRKLGFSFEILSGDRIKPALPQLKQISDCWLSHKGHEEKGFSLGFFNEDYLCKTPVAVVRDTSGHIAAFANLWQTANKQELSADLMRYSPEAAGGIMEYLFVELLLWAQQQRYQCFSLGIAPLSGLERRALAPLWHKIGSAIFDFGERFYNFAGLYHYKAKFNPVWEPRYLAAPSGLAAPAALIAATRLIAKGGRRMPAD